MRGTFALAGGLVVRARCKGESFTVYHTNIDTVAK